MRYSTASSEFFIATRTNLAGKLKPGCLAILNACDVLPSCADGTLPFRQNSDLFYLTGVDQEETKLLLFPDAVDEKDREILFLRETDEQIAIWEGAGMSRQEAGERTGVSNVRWLADFDATFRRLMTEAAGIYLNSNEHPRASVVVETRDARFIRQCCEQFPLHERHRLAPLMAELRMVKAGEEVDLIRRACGITGEGFRRVLGFVRPGRMEYEIEAEYAHEFLRSGSRGFAYQPIIASGRNSCVLHYVANHAECRQGDMLLMDVGAEYGYYNADLTRTVPVSGRFTPRQRDVYDVVLRLLREASAMLRPGMLLADYEKQVGSLVEGELIGLGLLEKSKLAAQDPERPLYKQYFMHGTSHHLGLDVHDVALKHRPLAEGMVLTVEPGLYLPEEGFGVRLENDILIGREGNIDLLADVPIDPDEIEDMMNL
jgi:Xaa-Pro aminopeptidase